VGGDLAGEDARPPPPLEEEGRVLRRESTGLVRIREGVLVRLGFDFRMNSL